MQHAAARARHTREHCPVGMRFPQLSSRLAGSLSIAPKAVDAVVSLLRADATVPFIVRYRQEETGGLDTAGLDPEQREMLAQMQRAQALLEQDLGPLEHSP